MDPTPTVKAVDFIGASGLLVSFSDGRAAVLTAKMLYEHAVSEAEICPRDEDDVQVSVVH